MKTCMSPELKKILKDPLKARELMRIINELTKCSIELKQHTISFAGNCYLVNVL